MAVQATTLLLLKNYFRLIGILFFVVLTELIAPAQSEQAIPESSFFLEPKIRVGPLLDIYPNLPEHGLPVSGEINVAWQTRGHKYWHQSFHFPQVGVILSATSFSNPQELGGEFSLVPNLSYHLNDFGKFRFTGTFGTGFAFFNKPYDRVNNPDNKLIGSRITNKTVLALDLEYALSKHIGLTGGVSYLHYSNGHFQLPNVGINIPALQLGVKYFPSGYPEEVYKRDTLPSYSLKWLVNLRFGLGIHEFGDPVKPVMGPKYPIYSVSIYMSRRTGLVTNFQAGLHLNYYSSFYDYIEFHEFYEDRTQLKSVTALAFAGMEFLFDHIGMTGQMGLYLYNPFYRDLQELKNTRLSFSDKAKQYLSLKLGAQYYIFSTAETTRLNPWIGIFLKTNAGQADFAELSIGIAF